MNNCTAEAYLQFYTFLVFFFFCIPWDLALVPSPCDLHSFSVSSSFPFLTFPICIWIHIKIVIFVLAFAASVPPLFPSIVPLCVLITDDDLLSCRSFNFVSIRSLIATVVVFCLPAEWNRR